jgi:hypothetical protein
LIALAAAAGWIAWKSELIRQPVTTGIAVLPFENLSSDKENAYFADGIQDEILTRVSKIAFCFSPSSIACSSVIFVEQKCGPHVLQNVQSSLPLPGEFRRGIDSSAARSFALAGLPIYVASTPVGSIRARFRDRVRD